MFDSSLSYLVAKYHRQVAQDAHTLLVFAESRTHLAKGAALEPYLEGGKLQGQDQARPTASSCSSTCPILLWIP